MWTIIKLDKKKLSFIKKDFKDILGKDLTFYSPKLLIEKYKNNKLTYSEISLLGDYVFCYHEKFKKPGILNILKFTRGLKYFLNGFNSSQIEIENFINYLKKLENSKGYIVQNIFKIIEENKYKFLSGPFTSQIFKILEVQKNNMIISIGKLKTKINTKKFLFYPI